MAKFKVGDVVKTKKQYVLWQQGAIGVIQGFAKSGSCCVDFFKGIIGQGHNCCLPEIIPDQTGLWVNEDDLEKVVCETEYDGIHIGDRIKLNNGYYGWIKKGSTGTVVAFDTSFGIRFDKKFEFDGHTLTGAISEPRGAWIEKEYFKVIHHIIGEKEELTPVSDEIVEVNEAEAAVNAIRELFQSMKE